jgi:hypothetical protein
LLNCCVACFVLPGIRDATLIVTLFACAEALAAPATEIELTHTAIRLATVTATRVAIRVDFIATPFR